MEHPVEIPGHQSHYSFFQLTHNKCLKLPPMTRVHKSRLTKKSNVCRVMTDRVREIRFSVTGNQPKMSLRQVKQGFSSVLTIFDDFSKFEKSSNMEKIREKMKYKNKCKQY